MPQNFSQTVRNTFNKGLLTEYSELNFPNEASVDELNCELFKAGNRKKRKGIQLEAGYAEVSGFFSPDRLYHTATWKNVGQNADEEYLIVQSGNRLYFFKKGTKPLSEQQVPTSDADPTPYVVELSAYNVPGGLGAGGSKIDVASINGLLVVVSPQLEPFYIEKKEDGSFTETRIVPKVRDYEWQGTTSLYSEQSISFPAGIGRQYDTKNCGWADGPDGIGDTALETYKVSQSKWPPLTHPWYSGKDSGGSFSVVEWQKVYSGTTLIGNGHYILDLFSKNRAEVSGIPEIETEETTSRFSTVAAYAGRVWYAGHDSRVYYSQIIEDNSQIGLCYRINDPTSEENPSALATDGGYINLPEANGIKQLQAFGSSLLVFADNGVWRISGIDGNLFKSDDYSIYKVTDNGLAFRSSLIAAQNSVPFWWSYTGIHTLQVTDQGGLVELSISRDTIQTFWSNIDPSARGFVTSAYDAYNNQILWMYPNTTRDYEYKFNNILLLDIDLGAFFPWTVSDTTTGFPSLMGQVTKRLNSLL